MEIFFDKDNIAKTERNENIIKKAVKMTVDWNDDKSQKKKGKSVLQKDQNENKSLNELFKIKKGELAAKFEKNK